MTSLLPPTELPAPIDRLIDEAQSAEKASQTEEARGLYERALHSLSTDMDSRVASALVRWIGRTYYTDGDMDAAVDCFTVALEIAAQLGDPAGIAHALNHLGYIHQYCGQLDEAERMYRRALELAELEGDRRLVAMVQQNLGIVCNIRGDLDEALHRYQMSLTGYRTLLMDDHVGLVLNNLGMLYTDLRQWQQAELAFQEALETCQRTGNASARVAIQSNRSELWILQRDFGRAKEACLVALRLAQELGDLGRLAEAHKNYGVILREEGDLRGAEAQLVRAAEIAETRRDLLLAAETARELADVKWRQQENRSTLQYLNRAHRLFTELRARLDLADIDQRVTHFETMFLEIVRRWGDSIESKDRYTQGHCERVTDYACAIAQEMGFHSKDLFWFRMGALLHDVGKIVVPIEVLNKPGKLDPDERQLMETHPDAGVELLNDIEFPWDIRPMVRHHHERWDGTGYPSRLGGDDIPLAARILCVADVYDALSSDRPYRAAFSPTKSLSIMAGDAGTMFDPDIFPILPRILGERFPA